MAPLWLEILRNIEPILNASATDDAANELDVEDVRLALFSGHDSTLNALMASLELWNTTDFPSYASMLIIEVSVLCLLVLSYTPATKRRYLDSNLWLFLFNEDTCV